MSVPDPLKQNEILNKEVSIGAIRELPVDESLLYPTFCPLHEVASDDVFFEYAVPEIYGKAPARAEDAESVVVRHDDTAGYGRASIVDWALKNSYSASDVTRYREYLSIVDQFGGDTGALPLFAQQGNELQTKMARDQNRRRKALDNRIESLFIQGLEFNTISYNDGDVIFSVNYERPAGQTVGAAPSGTAWDDAGGAHDPIGDFIDIKQTMWDTYGTTIGTAIMSEKTAWLITKATLFAQMAMTPGDTVAGDNIDPYYALRNFGMDAVVAKVQAATGVRIVTYDAGIRTRAWGTNTLGFTRNMTEGKVILLPAQADIDALSDTDFGFAATLTSPHPEGGFTPGFYSWEEEEKDPWRVTVGTGIKAFPVMPHMEYTYVFTAHAPSGGSGAFTQPGAPTP